jgi:intracellular septation protein A
MDNLKRSALLLASDLASTIVFLAVLLVTRHLILAVAIGVGLGLAQIGWMMARRKPIDAMQWLSIGLVVASGVATMLTSDARFVMLKPSVVYFIAGTFMLRPGWMNRYLPPAAVAVVPDLAYAFGFAWAGLMYASAALNVALALTLDPVTWSMAISAWGIASKVALFLVQYLVMTAIGRRRRVARTAADRRTESDKRAIWLAAGEFDLRVSGKIRLHFDNSCLSSDKTPPKKYQNAAARSFEGVITRLEPMRVLAHT